LGQRSIFAAMSDQTQISREESEPTELEPGGEASAEATIREKVPVDLELEEEETQEPESGEAGVELPAAVEDMPEDSCDAVSVSEEPSESLPPTAEATAADSVPITNESVVEAILFAADSPLQARKIADLLGVGDAREVKKHIASLNERYQRTGASFRIEEVAGGFQMLTLSAYNTWVGKLHTSRNESKLSQAAMETLAIVAYKQPVLRVTVEAIRGVSAGEMLNRLREMGLVKIVGRAEELGRPMLYGTTKKFLEVFGLSSLEDLPQVEELKAPS
jgi:segregation and condensation protein B